MGRLQLLWLPVSPVQWLIHLCSAEDNTRDNLMLQDGKSGA